MVLLPLNSIAYAAEPPELRDDQVASDTDSVRGVVRALNRAVLSAGVSSRIDILHSRIGQSFETQQTLVEFNCAIEKAQTKSALAALDLSRQNFNKQKELASFDAVGGFDVDIAKAEMGRAEADYLASKAVSDQCKIVAPFSGSVVQTFVKQFETAQAGQPVIEIVQVDRFEVNLVVTSQWLGQLSPGQEVPFLIDETGSTETLRIDRIGPVVDPISQTIEIIGIIDQPGPFLKPGMGGNVDLSRLIGG